MKTESANVLIEELAGLSGCSRDRVLQAFLASTIPNSNGPNGSSYIELNLVEEALQLEPGFFRRVVGRI